MLLSKFGRVVYDLAFEPFTLKTSFKLPLRIYSDKINIRYVHQLMKARNLNVLSIGASWRMNAYAQMYANLG